MTQHHRYRGHDIRIDLIEVVPRRFRWRWTIDGKHVSQGGAALLSEEMARSEAFLYAQVMIARLRRPLAAA